MTGYEILSIVISCIALAASVWTSFVQRRASITQRKLQTEANDLQRATSELGPELNQHLAMVGVM